MKISHIRLSSFRLSIVTLALGRTV